MRKKRRGSGEKNDASRSPVADNEVLFSHSLSLSLSSRLISIALPPFFLLSLGFSLRLADRDPSLSPEVALELAF